MVAGNRLFPRNIEAILVLRRIGGATLGLPPLQRFMLASRRLVFEARPQRWGPRGRRRGQNTFPYPRLSHDLTPFVRRVLRLVFQASTPRLSGHTLRETEDLDQVAGRGYLHETTGLRLQFKRGLAYFHA